MKIKDATRRISDGDLCIYYDGTEDFKFRMKAPEELSDITIMGKFCTALHTRPLKNSRILI